MDKYFIRDLKWIYYWFAKEVLLKMCWYSKYDYITKNKVIRFPKNRNNRYNK